MAIGNSWSAVSEGRLITGAGGGWINSRVLWRRPDDNRFEFMLQLQVNNSISANFIRVWFTANNISNGAEGSAATWHWSGQGASGWQQVGPVWVRTAAQVGSSHQIIDLGCQIRFQTGNFVFSGTQIGMGTWHIARSSATINLGTPNQLHVGNTGVFLGNTPVVR